MHTSKFPVLACATVGIVSCFLPWTNVLVFGQEKTLTGMQYSEGYLTLICFILIGAAAFLQGRLLSFSTNFHKILTLVSIVTAGGLYYKILHLQNQAAKMLSFKVDMNHYVIYNPTIGIYLTAAASLGIALAAVYQIVLQYKPVVHKTNWFEASPEENVTGRYYLPS